MALAWSASDALPDAAGPIAAVLVGTASIGDGSGATVFEQKDVEVPEGWSQLATNVVASKYFRGHLGTPDRERSVRQLVHRVADTIAEWGSK